MQDIYLILENGLTFKGKSFGAYKETAGEVVFTTAMTGYPETLTDPSYFGQIIVQTFPLIGNYGVMTEDFESGKIYARAYVVREKCDFPSNFRCEMTIDEFLKKEGIPGIYGIDTRRLTKAVREKGVMNGKISFTPDFDESIKDYKIIDAVKSTTCESETCLKAENAKKKVVLFDFGAKKNIERELLKRGCDVTVVPAYTSFERIKELNPDGIMLSNGPGDPAENTEIIENLKKICTLSIPTFGICLGHQLLALANGAKTEKLKYGHRGANQPVVNTETKRVYISSQNHGYHVKSETLCENAVLTYVNGNDGSCEGIRYKNIPAFSVQFHPEACGGPQDTEFLFDEFVKLMEVNG